MEVSTMGVWAWLRPGNRVWKVISDYEKGTISVFDEKNNIVMEKKGLSKEAIEIVEKNFLDTTATNLEDKNKGSDCHSENKFTSNDNDPMYC
jgi:hypothetical protein